MVTTARTTLCACCAKDGSPKSAQSRPWREASISQSQETLALSQPALALSQPTLTFNQHTLALSQPTNKFPYGFWKRYITERLHLRYNDALVTACHRALDVFLVHREGSTTRVGLRAGRKGKSCRDSNAARNSVLARGLGFQLLQFVLSISCKGCMAGPTAES